MVAGALTGGLVGWGAVKLSQYQATQTMTATQMEAAGLARPVTTTTVNIRSGVSVPQMVRPGSHVKVVTDYLVMAPTGTPGCRLRSRGRLKRMEGCSPRCQR